MPTATAPANATTARPRSPSKMKNTSPPPKSVLNDPTSEANPINALRPMTRPIP